MNFKFLKRMKLNQAVFSLALVFIASVSVLSTEAAAFSDVTSHWAEKTIQKWSEQYNIIQGYPDGTFRPDGTITRGEFATILDRFMQYQKKSPSQTFSDIEGSWCEESVLKLHSAGVYLGAMGKAMSDSNITRQQAVTMLGRAFNISESFDITPYDDAAEAADYAWGFIVSMNKLGYLNGVNFRPQDAITRAEVVQILDRMVSEIWTPNHPLTSEVLGTLMINSANGASLNGITIQGDLIIAPGVNGNIYLNDMIINGEIRNLGYGEIIIDNEQEPPERPEIPDNEYKNFITYHDKKIPIVKDIDRNKLTADDFYWDNQGRLVCTSNQFNTRFGIDVSAYQNRNTPGQSINWNDVADDGVEFAIVRVAYRGYSTGKLNADDFYRQNIEGALSAGIDTGAYVFSQATSVEEAIEEADYVLSLVDGYNLTGPIVYDWEIGNSSYRVYNVEPKVATAAAVAFCEKIAAAGYEPMVYCSKATGYLKFDLAQLKDYTMWYPEYKSSSSDSYNPTFYYQMDYWQYSDKISIKGIGGNVDANLQFVQSSSQENTADKNYSHKPIDVTDWKLLLVNPWNKLPSDFSIERTTLKNGHSIDKRAYNDLQDMMDDARAEGLTPIICSSFRTMEKQQSLFDNQIQKYISRGYSMEEAEKEAAKWVAVPGTSEHQSGLALDIVALSYQLLDEKQENTAEQKWLTANSYKYGFILRYPKDKTDITGMGYEPWHYRYVGKEAAKGIFEQGICLEEYLEYNK